MAIGSPQPAGTEKAKRASPAQILARARSNPAREAVTVLLQCLVGQVDPRTGEIQRKAALDVLSGALWQTMSDAQLKDYAQRIVAEVANRRSGAAAAEPADG